MYTNEGIHAQIHTYTTYRLTRYYYTEAHKQRVPSMGVADGGGSLCEEEKKKQNQNKG